MRKYINLSKYVKTSLGLKCYEVGIKMYKENNVRFLEYKGKSITADQSYPEAAIKRNFNITIK